MSLRKNENLLEAYDIGLVKDYSCTLCLNKKAADATTIPLLSGNAVKDVAGFLDVSFGMSITDRELSIHKRNHIKVTEKDKTIVDEFKETAVELKQQAMVEPEHEEIVSSTINKLSNEIEKMSAQGQYRTDEYLKLIKEYRSWLELRTAKPAVKVEFTASDLLKKLVLEEAVNED